jgi:hypothetical protein
LCGECGGRQAKGENGNELTNSDSPPALDYGAFQGSAS